MRYVVVRPDDGFITDVRKAVVGAAKLLDSRMSPPATRYVRLLHMAIMLQLGVDVPEQLWLKTS